MLMFSYKVKNTPSPLTGEGQGEGEESRNFKKLFIPLPIIPSRQGRGILTFYDSINAKLFTKVPIGAFCFLVFPAGRSSTGLFPPKRSATPFLRLVFDPQKRIDGSALPLSQSLLEFSEHIAPDSWPVYCPPGSGILLPDIQTAPLPSHHFPRPSGGRRLPACRNMARRPSGFSALPNRQEFSGPASSDQSDAGNKISLLQTFPSPGLTRK